MYSGDPPPVFNLAVCESRTMINPQVARSLAGAAPRQLDGLAEQAARTRLTLVTSKPVPFPPEPVRSAVVQLTRSSLARADRHEGRRDAWRRLLERLGLGFDS